MNDETRERSRRVPAGAEAARMVQDGVWILPAQGNALAVDAGDGIVLMDAGPGGSTTAKVMQALRGFTAKPVTAICYSHGHLGYNDGAMDWLRHNAERGDTAPQLIAHEN